MVKVTKDLASLVDEVSPKRKAKSKTILLDLKHLPEAHEYLKAMAKKHECSMTTFVKVLIESARKRANEHT